VATSRPREAPKRTMRTRRKKKTRRNTKERIKNLYTSSSGKLDSTTSCDLRSHPPLSEVSYFGTSLLLQLNERFVLSFVLCIPVPGIWTRSRLKTQRHWALERTHVMDALGVVRLLLASAAVIPAQSRSPVFDVDQSSPSRIIAPPRGQGS
jgi:hypothetical protein